MVVDLISVTESKVVGKNRYVRIIGSIELIDTETGFSRTWNNWVAEGYDTGDKYLTKAITYLTKSWIQANLLIGYASEDPDSQKVKHEGKPFEQGGNQNGNNYNGNNSNNNNNNTSNQTWDSGKNSKPKVQDNQEQEVKEKPLEAHEKPQQSLDTSNNPVFNKKLSLMANLKYLVQAGMSMDKIDKYKTKYNFEKIDDVPKDRWSEAWEFITVN